MSKSVPFFWCNFVVTVILKGNVSANGLNETIPTFKFKNPWLNLEKLFCFHSNTIKV